MNPRVFREYDIRGVADRDLTPEFVTALGRALGVYYREHGVLRVALGRDCRLHSPRLHEVLKRELLAAGINLIDVGQVATPVLYYAVFHYDLDGGIQITGSHNPGEDNGFKILAGKSTIHGSEIQALRKLVESAQAVSNTPVGTIEERDIIAPYIEMVLARISLGTRRFRIVVDAGNGMGGVAVPILRQLGFEVTELYCEPDGSFPNHHPDPTVEENVAALKKEVERQGAEIGLAFDGDADRLGVVDARGRVVWGDQLMILFARSILREVPGAKFVSEVKCSQALYDEVARAGGEVVMWKVGHSLIKEKMKQVGAQLAGEMSGHLFFAHRYFGYDDAIYAAMRLIEILSHDKTTLAEHVDSLPVVFNTPEIRYPVADELKFQVVEQVKKRLSNQMKAHGIEQVIDIDGVRARFSDGWALVRASNTQAALVLRFEAANEARLAAIRSVVEKQIDAAHAELSA